MRKQKRRAFGLLVIGIVSSLSALPAFSDSGSQANGSTFEPDAAAQCKALSRADFSDIIEAPTDVTAARPVEGTENLRAHCEVQGYVSPQVGFKLGLPASDWNGKFLEFGCGGDCGDLGIYGRLCAAPLQRGYACIVFDSGHTGAGGVWAMNNLQAQVDFGYRAAHVTAVSGKAITERYYRKAPAYSYFSGCSTGGRQALVQAQRFPWDFNGIISGAPWINDTDSAMNMVWAHRALRGQDGKPVVNRADLKLVHDAVLARCDMDDGMRDGIIGNPIACKFDPRELVCRDSKKTGCLTPAQAGAMSKVYSGPRNSQGQKAYISGAALGSEMGWVDEGLLDYIRSDNSSAGSEGWASIYFRYMVMPAAGPGWKLTDFDFAHDYKRFGAGVQEALLNAGNPDLRKFKAAGGKLLIYQGWNDQSDLPQMTIDYYEMVERTMGGRKNTQDFARLFVVPGMLHCTGGEGAFAIDYLTYLEKWVEHTQPPDVLIGAHVDDAYLLRQGEPLLSAKASDDGIHERVAKLLGAIRLRFPLDSTVPVTFTRPVYPYPLRTQYKGRGDPNSAENFERVE